MILKYIVTFLISMVPLIELRGAVPFGLSDAMGGSLSVIPLYIVCIIGNMVPVPLIYFFARKVLEWGKKLESKAGKGLYWALFIFVGIPFPGTGAWTGTLAASFLDMDFKKSVIAIVCGVILAGIIMGLASAGLFGAAGAIFAK